MPFCHKKIGLEGPRFPTRRKRSETTCLRFYDRKLSLFTNFRAGLRHQNPRGRSGFVAAERAA